MTAEKKYCWDEGHEEADGVHHCHSRVRLAHSDLCLILQHLQVLLEGI